jgi:hypothetical protein
MTLASETEDRYKGGLLLELTNQGSTTATTVDQTVLGLAAVDAAAEFQLETGLVLDITDTRHLAAGIVGVLHFLHEYTGIQSERGGRIRDRWLSWLERIAATAGHELKVLPRSGGRLVSSTPTDQRAPDGDRTRWDRYTLKQPGGSTQEDIDGEDFS